MQSPYTDHPDGKDCLTKIIYLSKLGLYGGVFTSVYDVILYTKPKGFGPTALRVFATTTPFIVSAATFGAVACAATSIRKKDTHLNYTIAGCAAGTVLGIGFRKPGLAALMFFIGGITGTAIKDSLINGWYLLGWNKENDGSQYFDRTLYVKKSSGNS